ncbi:hypothetical protein WA1_06955 [Scytonema hofmannii PCC 7110]|uniref:VWFA domain-containing protein n=1 Tax=Scytonema hofmannii PCC 7110 TaxID=128403 RepID=A0A139WSY3_9CYAN|nr:DUF1194 domain-containing protein [Scytonema hofmannii]KYC35555.1 hypothetical protein WA1_06955 [Scytonema hofmannii PCC 7110]
MKIFNFVRATLTAVSCGLSVLAISTSTQAATLTPVDTELSLLVDVSGSISEYEFDLQKKGYVNTFLNPNLFNDFISKGSLGKIAVNVIYWSNAQQQQEAVGWTLIDSVAAAQQFANAIDATTRQFFGVTAPGSAIAFATPKFFNNDFEGTRQVIDVSGDGAENDGTDTATVRNLALAQGIDAINGIIVGSDPLVKKFYQEEILGGINGDGSPAFLIEAATFEEFNSAIDKKIKAEIKVNLAPATVAPIPLKATPTPVPEASSMLGLLALGAVRAGSMLTQRRKCH